MSSNKIIFSFFIFSLVLFFYSCAEKKENPTPAKDYDNPAIANAEAKAILGNNVKFAYKGKFDEDSAIELVAGTEISNKNEWGIRFEFLKEKDNKFEKIYESGLLQGSVKESITKKIKFPSFDYELIYYNSSDYFLGSGGGEVFCYIVDFNKHDVFYAHLIQDKGISLFLSNNIDNPDIKNFFISLFRKDYPNLKLISKDIDLIN